METKVINLFGNPGSGKSTTASYLFSELKAKGYEVELVVDVAKDLVWDNDLYRLSNQLLVFSNQLQKLDRLIDKVDYAITDSPLLMQIGFYKERHLPAPKQFKKLCIAYNNYYNNINIMLKSRNREISQVGRAELNLNPMKYLSTMQFDLKTDCLHREKILDFILKGEH